jgi:hypothetical protein
MQEIFAFSEEISGILVHFVMRFADFLVHLLLLYIPFLRLQANVGGDGESRFECRLQDPT